MNSLFLLSFLSSWGVSIAIVEKRGLLREIIVSTDVKGKNTAEWVGPTTPEPTTAAPVTPEPTTAAPVTPAPTDPTCDTSTWEDKKLECGSCKVLVKEFRKHKSCDKYCGKVGRSCVAAWEEKDDSCEVESTIDCGTEHDTKDAICECSVNETAEPTTVAPVTPAPTDPTCDTSTWEDKKLECGSCKVLVKEFRKHKSCDKYCEKVGRSCVAAWEEKDDSCEVESTIDCGTEHDTKDAICECSAAKTLLSDTLLRSIDVEGKNKEEVLPVGTIKCDMSTWDNKKKECDGSCTVLVGKFRSYGSCDKYCETFGHKCVGAWEEKDDNCEVESKLKCSADHDSPDAICQCEG